MTPLSLILLVVLSPLAIGAEPAPVDDIRILLRAALDAPDGKAQGQLARPVAQAFKQRFQTEAPILVVVSTLKRYRQPGCSRLNLSIHQNGVLLPGSSVPRPQTLDIGINYCRSGPPPASLD